ncbi:MAG: glycosyltransferase [Hyphomicrobium sp.]
MRLFITHDLSLTGAPRLLVDTYKALRREGDLLIAKRGGPLGGELTSGGFQFHISDTSHELSVTYKSALAYAREIIDQRRPSIVYANTVASIEWVVAASEAGIPSILHVHELDAVRNEFSAIGHYSIDRHRLASLTLCASDRIEEQLRHQGLPADQLKAIGVAIDVGHVLSKVDDRTSEHDDYFALRHSGFGEGRRRHCMVGSACYRKGIDIFLETAVRMQDRDFIWIGGQSQEAFMTGFRSRIAKAPSNFYCTGWLINPFPILADCESLILTAREDPNPLVVYEALVLGKKVVCFADTGDSHIKVRKYFPVSSGRAEPARIEMALRVQDDLPVDPSIDERANFRSYLSEIEQSIANLIDRQ